MRSLLAAAFGVAALAAAFQSRAATIAETAEFTFVLNSLETPDAFVVDLPLFDGSANVFFGSGNSSVSVQPFDSTLGQLLGVSVSLDSSFDSTTRHLIFALGPEVQGLSYVYPLQLRFRRGGGPLYTREIEFYGECAEEGQACGAVAQATGLFALAAADDPAAYLGDEPVDFSLVIDLDGGANFFFLSHPHRAFFVDSVTTWSGELRVTYEYEPAVAPPVAVPAPASASLLALGLAGLWLRRSAKATGALR